MRKALILTLAGAAISSAADASDGCGAGWHRNDHGRCRPNHDYRDDGYRDYGYSRGVVVAPEVGRFYQDRGYWDGERYYQHRRWDGDWHYW